MSEQNRPLRLVKEVPAPPERVFEAWLDPAALARFMCPAEGSSVARAEVDARAGGAFLIVMHIGGQDLPHRGEYLEIVPHERLVFTWLSHVAGPGSRVTLTFEPLASGHTRLTLEHVGLDESVRGKHEQGWTQILKALAAATPP
jgi:uncharacterized protein YndB with AHSA1/START domain